MSNYEGRIGHTRPPRVEVLYDLHGSRRSLPLVVGVVAPLSGDGPSKARWVAIDRDNFNDVFARIAPTLRLPQGTLAFGSMDDFEPAALRRQIEPQMPPPADPGTPAPPPTQKPPAPPRDGRELLAGLLGEEPPPPGPKDFITGLVEEALRGTPVLPGKEPEEKVRSLDAIRAALHEPAFQQLEAAWRGLHYLVHKADTGATLKVKVFDGRKEELADAVTAACQSADEVFGLIVGDFVFDQSNADVAILLRVMQQAARAFCLFVSGASPRLLGIESWADLPRGRDVAAVADDETWQAMRSLPQARYVALTAPRVLGRLPYGKNQREAEGIAFEEGEPGKPLPHEQYLWMNAAYAWAACVTGSYEQTGWFTPLRGAEGGGLVENLPVHYYCDEYGETTFQSPAERTMDDEQEQAVARRGLLVLSHIRNSDRAAFFGARSIQLPRTFDDPELSRTAEIASRLPFVLTAGRFMHVIRRTAPQWRTAQECEEGLNAWLADFVGQPGELPLADAQVQVSDGPDGRKIEVYLRPWLRGEELPAAVGLETAVP